MRTARRSLWCAMKYKENRMDMNFEKNASVKFEDYTKKPLQMDSNPTTMEVVTRTNAVKSPTNSPKAPKLVYTVKEVAQMLAISQRAAYNLCNSTTEFRVLRAGGSIRIPKDSFDAWLSFLMPCRGAPQGAAPVSG